MEIIKATWKLKRSNIYIEYEYPRDVINQRIFLRKYFKDKRGAAQQKQL